MWLMDDKVHHLNITVSHEDFKGSSRFHSFGFVNAIQQPSFVLFSWYITRNMICTPCGSYSVGGWAEGYLCNQSLLPLQPPVPPKSESRGSGNLLCHVIRGCRKKRALLKIGQQKLTQAELCCVWNLHFCKREISLPSLQLTFTHRCPS